MTPFFPSQFTAARTTPCVTQKSAEGVALSVVEGHLVISIVRGDGIGMAVVLDEAAADVVAGHLADALMTLTRRAAPSLSVVQ